MKIVTKCYNESCIPPVKANVNVPAVTRGDDGYLSCGVYVLPSAGEEVTLLVSRNLFLTLHKRKAVPTIGVFVSESQHKKYKRNVILV